MQRPMILSNVLPFTFGRVDNYKRALQALSLLFGLGRTFPVGSINGESKGLGMELSILLFMSAEANSM